MMEQDLKGRNIQWSLNLAVILIPEMLFETTVFFAVDM